MPDELRDPEINFEKLWKTFHDRYPFFKLRNVDWKKQYETYRPRVTRQTTDDELFDIFCEMLDPLDDGHVELKGRTGPGRRKRSFNPESQPRFRQEFSAREIKQLPNVTIIGEHTNGIFSYQLEKKLPNGWRYRLSYQVYMSADMVCYEGRGVPVDISLLNRNCDIEKGVDPLIIRALEVIQTKNTGRSIN